MNVSDDGDRWDARSTARLVSGGQLSARQSVTAALQRVKAVQERTNAFITIPEQQAVAAAEELDGRLAAGQKVGRLAGVPIVVKDNLVTAGVRTTAGSRMLADFVPPYDATVVARLLAQDAILVAKTNLDEFGMGSGNENSPFGPVRHPRDLTRVAGGSSGGSAAAVAAGAAPLALASDTGGSTRLPAAFCGVIGFKPSYGALSRYGLVAYASSLDHIGLLGSSLDDVQLAYELTAHADPQDATSVGDSGRPASPEVGGLRVGLLRQLGGDGFAPAVRAAVAGAAARLEGLGAQLVELSVPSVLHAPVAYHVIAAAEASSNLARFDGTLYGGRVGADADGQEAVMAATRGALFGTEVKRRLLFGSLALSDGYYRDYYGRALQVRRLLADALRHALGQVDVLLLPSSADVAFPLGEAGVQPFQARFGGHAYHADMANSLANLAGLPALSVPFGTGDGGLPLGVQLMGAAGSDRRVLALARHLT